jgi:hypothetical protein
MRHIYYGVIDYITDWITGMNHRHLSLDEFAVWVKASAKVEGMVYVGIISILIAISVWGVFYLIKEYQMDLDEA